jgi:hypothetical protein
MILFLLLLLATDVQAQTCYPSDRLVYQSLKGCDAILKREETEVVYPGFSKRVIQEGTGGCEQRTTCNPLAYPFAGKEECWPQFKDPVTGYGTWTRIVVNAKVTIGYVGSCSEKNGDFVESVPLLGPKCAPADQTIYRVDHTCETVISGQLPWFNPFPQEPVCSWGFIPGMIYCGDLEPVNK